MKKVDRRFKNLTTSRQKTQKRYREWRKKYAKYVEKLNAINKRTGQSKQAYSYKRFRELAELAKTAPERKGSHESISSWMAKTQSYTTSYEVAKTARKRAAEEGLDDIPSIDDILVGRVSTRDLADLLGLRDVYHQLRSGANGDSPMSAMEAKHYISQYYFGSN